MSGNDNDSFIPRIGLMEYDDPRFEITVLNATLPILNRHQGAVLGIESVPNTPLQLELDGIRWHVAHLQKRKVYPIPPSVYQRHQAIKRELTAIGYKFTWMLWGEEQKGHPSTTLPRLMFDGMNLYWVKPGQKVPPGMRCIYDPILIGIIRTAPHRGIWVKLGAWFD